MTNNNCECGVWINESDIDRYELWQRILDQKNPFVFIKSIFPERAKNGLFYKVEIKRLSKFQKDNMVSFLSDKFNLPKETIQADIDNDIIPIKQDNTTLNICKTHSLAML